MTSAILYGLDIGGTKIGVAVGDREGNVLARDRLPNDSTAAPRDQLDAALRRLDALCTEHRLAAPTALGAACPGPLSYREGRLLEVPNMPLWQQFEIQSFLAQRLEVPFAFMNDANASVLAESYWGAARGCDHAIFLTMSTGMGAGLLLGGRVYEGATALAGEIGHLRLTDDGPVGFGKRGSVEGYLSGPGMVQVAEAELLACRQTGRATLLSERPLSTEHLLACAQDGDAAAIAVLDRCGEKLGQLCATLVDLLNPDVVILGTIGSAHFELFEPRIRAVLTREALPAAAAHVRIAPSGLTDRGNQTALAIARRAIDG